jgi:hypothetical protein
MERLYRDDDWRDFVASIPTHLTVRGITIPYVVFDNENDFTTSGGAELRTQLEKALERLWSIRKGK